MSTYMLSASSLIGNNVKSTSDESLGDVKDIMMNPHTGEASYAVLSFGGFLGLGDKYFAVPFEALTLDREDQSYRLNVDKDRLKDAPGFDKNNWPDFADPSFKRSISDYYAIAA